ncbi:Nucleotide-binding universal stress protein, UspA family [Methylobacterium sp. UNC378MF]|jgi:nucleotide-binding universal stress UspA family protein|uniref:universal stress protein n=1 Tax=Methylobacterium sp. UNC378MF TaxID=1502748 RepID=UPI000887EEA2|nr:universal stress protein [Methylobacterium sp. UNC378MF]SDA28988.1 Nucleotide-binding universal stress protein, UspA family [Methylobacterium sp. UNC378MF]
MDYANILVSADLGEAAPDRIRLAADLTRRFEATLTGVAAHTVPAPILVRDVYDAIDQEGRNKAQIQAIVEQARASFERFAGDGIRTDWRWCFADATAHLIEQARAADLVVVSRRGPGDEDPGPLGVPPDPVLMEGGRPVLVVPPRTVSLKASRIVVAWKDSPETRRAVSGALPLLREADTVFVATVGSGARHDGAEDVASHLARHGASATVHHLQTVDDDGSEILRFALLRDTDLIVAGAYGHSRLREWVFGGVTRDLLDRSPLCCLMSH